LARPRAATSRKREVVAAHESDAILQMHRETDVIRDHAHAFADFRTKRSARKIEDTVFFAHPPEPARPPRFSE
jgi:hypothetical protein